MRKPYLNSELSKKIAPYFLIAIFVSVITLYQLGLHSWDAFTFPIAYQGDGLNVLALLQMGVDGSVFDPKSDRLGFPEHGSLLKYYPIPEKLIFVPLTLLSELTSVYIASNLAEVLAHILPSLVFFFIAQKLTKERLVSVVLALAYGLAPFIFSRGLGHITVGWTCLLPAQVYLVNYITYGHLRFEKSEVGLFATTTLLSSLLNPYYYLLYMQFLIMLLFREIFRKETLSSRRILTWILLSALCFLIANGQYVHEKFTGYSSTLRNLASLEVYGLKLPELFLPAGYHKIELFSKWAHASYYSVSFIKGELWSPYLGLVGILALISLGILQTLDILKRGAYTLTPYTFQVIWVALFSVVGGVNLLLGVVGFQYLRATNRLSIWILTVVLLFGCSLIAKYKLPLKRRVTIIGLLVPLIFLDLPAPYSPELRKQIAEVVEKDRIFSRKIEQSLEVPRVAVLPAMDYPENGPILKMLDYTPMRLYLNSDRLNVSYGGPKFLGKRVVDGIGSTEKLGPMNTHFLKANGYNSIVLVKDGFSEIELDKGVMLLNNMNAKLISESDDFIAFSIKDLNRFEDDSVKTLPIAKFLDGWSEPEESWRWSIALRAKLAILSPKSCTDILIQGSLQSFGASRTVHISANNVNVWEGQVGQEKKPIKIRVRDAGVSLLDFKISGKPMKPFGDPRFLTISIHDLELDCL